jgi:polar amino acid transport system substrate-binding protein
MKLFLSVLLILVAGLPFAGAQSRSLSAGSDLWPPFVDPGSPTQGLSVQVVREALATQGYSLTLTILPWARAELAVREGSIDLLPEAWLTEARKAEFLASEAYGQNEVRFVKRRGDPFEYRGLASLAGKKVGTVRGYAYGDAFLGDKGFERVESNDALSNLTNLVAGRLDLTLEDPAVVRALVRGQAPDLADKIDFTQASLSSNRLHVLVGRKNPRAAEILGAVSRGLALLRSNGRLEAILSSTP